MSNIGMSENPMQVNDLIEQLEFKVAFQEDTIDQLNQIVTKQQMRIDRLEQQQQVIIEKLKGVQNATSNINSGEEKPPHY